MARNLRSPSDEAFEFALGLAPKLDRILVVDGDQELTRTLATIERDKGATIQQARGLEEAVSSLKRARPDLVLINLRGPTDSRLGLIESLSLEAGDLPLIALAHQGSVREAVLALGAGAADYMVAPWSDGELLEQLDRALIRSRQRRTEGSARKITPRSSSGPESLAEQMGPSDAIKRLSDAVTTVAPTEFTALIRGETGSGKELVARAIHDQSLRATARFMAVDCGAIPEALFESMLFGHEKGAFTGANRNATGFFKAAIGGTIFLDEISSMELGPQGKLLRVLQEKQYYRVGASRTSSFEIRVVTASNRDLLSDEGATGFRSDLYYRLSEFPISVPPLRERLEDLEYLALRFVHATLEELDKAPVDLSQGALDALLAHRWPGNVRELRNVMRRATLLATDRIEAKHLGLRDAPTSAAMATPLTAAPTDFAGLTLKEIVRKNTDEVERAVIARALASTNGNVAEVARLLSADYKTIHSKIKKLDIDRSGA